MSQLDNRQPPSLKAQVQSQIAGEQLSRDQLQHLMAMQNRINNKHAEKTAIKSHAGKYWATSIAASLLVLVAVVSLWTPITSRPSLPNDLTLNQSALHKQIAMEVVKNHIKLKPLDIQTQSITEIQQFFKQLDFSPISSQQLNKLPAPSALTTQQLLGGRYCSIKGVTAAQLRYQQSNHGLSTLYQVGYDAKLFGNMPVSERGEPAQDLFVQGLEVSMWVEKGLLMVLVANPK